MFFKYYKMTMVFVVVFINCIELVCSSSSSSNVMEYNRHSDPNKKSIYSDYNPPKPGWIDPFDMTGEGETNYRPTGDLYVQSDVDNYLLKNRLEGCDVLMRKFVNSFLNNFPNKNPDTLYATDSLQHFNLRFFINREDLQTLKRFGGQGNNVGVESVYEILVKIFSHNVHEDVQYPMFTTILNKLQNVMMKLTRSPEMMVVSSVLLMLLGTIWLVYKTHSFRLAFFTISLTIMCAGYGFTWMRMYEEKEVERYHHIIVHGDTPYHCSGQPMAWYEHMYYRMFGVDCLQFYKVRDVRSIVKVSPTEVFAEMFSSMIINPAKNTGTAYAGFIRSVNGVLPWYMKVISVPLSFIIPPIVFILVLALLFNYSVTLSPWSGFRLTPNLCGSDQQSLGSRYVEDISPRDNKLKNTQNLPGIVTDNSETPLFFMNIHGLKKLIAESVLSDPADKDVNEPAISRENESENLSPESEGTESVQELEGLQAVLNRVEVYKASEMRKKRTKMTCTDGAEGTDTVINKLLTGEPNTSDKISEPESLKNKTA